MMNRAFFSGLPLLVAGAISLHSPAARADEAQAAAPVVDPANIPASAKRIAGGPKTYTPKLQWTVNGMTATANAYLAQRGEGVSTFPADRYGTGYQAGFAFAPQLRIGGTIDSGKAFNGIGVRVEYEHDLPTGYLTTSDVVAGSELPNTAPIDHQLRKLSLRASLGRYLHIGGGFTTNQFGLGLLANDGASNNWTPGSARFADNRGGDRVLRAYVATGPLTDLGITAAFAVDQIRGDDILLPGDQAIQIIGTVSAGHEKPTGAGLFVVHRRLTAPNGAHTEATAIDIAARHTSVGKLLSFSLEGEGAMIIGQTTVGATPEIPVYDVLQFGGVVRAAMRARRGGAVLDVLFASGDNNPDDARQTAFRADPNFETGLLLYRYVLAAQSGRATATAGDPNLVGVPSPGLERIPTRGSPTNTLAIFPRFYFRPLAGLEAYGGPLLAMTMAPLYDPLNTRVAGGVVKNALGGTPGNVLGIEFDLGARYRMLLWGTELTVGVEGAVLAPGSALSDADGNLMGGVFGGRAIVQYRL